MELSKQPEGTRSYLFGSEKYNGFPALCEALENNEALRNEVVSAIMAKTKGTGVKMIRRCTGHCCVETFFLPFTPEELKSLKGSSNTQ